MSAVLVAATLACSTLTSVSYLKEKLDPYEIEVKGKQYFLAASGREGFTAVYYAEAGCIKDIIVITDAQAAHVMDSYSRKVPIIYAPKKVDFRVKVNDICRISYILHNENINTWATPETKSNAISPNVSKTPCSPKGGTKPN